MKENIGGIVSVTIGDQTFNMADFENINPNPNSLTLTLDVETSKKYYQKEKEKLLDNSNVKLIKL